MPFYTPKSQNVCTKTPKRWVFSTTIVYRGTRYTNPKIAAEVAAIAKNIFISIYCTSQALKHKSAATLSTIAATFSSIIIEACPDRTPPNWRYNFCFVHQCSVLHSFGQKQMIFLIFKYFCSHLWWRIFVPKNVVINCLYWRQLS